MLGTVTALGIILRDTL